MASPNRRPSIPRSPLPPPPPKIRGGGLVRPPSSLGYFPYDLWRSILLQLTVADLKSLAPCSKAMSRLVSQVWKSVSKKRHNISAITGATKVAMAIEKPFSCCWMPKTGRLAVLTTSSELISLAVKGGVRIAFTTPEGRFDPSERVDISKEVAGSADVVVTEEGNFIVPDKEASCIVEFDSDGNELRRFGKDRMKWPRGVALMDPGWIIVADTFGNKVGMWNRTDGHLVQPLGDGQGRTDGKFLFPWAAAVVPPSCRLTAAETAARISTAPRLSVSSAPPSPAILRSISAQTPSSNNNSRAPSPSPLSRSSNSTPTPLPPPPAASDEPPGGEILIADTNNHRIQVFSRASSFLCAFGEEGTSGPRKMSFPSGLEVDGNDHVFVADATTRIQIWKLIRNGTGRVISAEPVHEFTINGLSAEPKRLRMRDDGRIAIVDVSNIYFF